MDQNSEQNTNAQPLGLVRLEIWEERHKLLSDAVSNQGTTSESKLNLREDFTHIPKSWP